MTDNYMAYMERSRTYDPTTEISVKIEGLDKAKLASAFHDMRHVIPDGVPWDEDFTELIERIKVAIEEIQND